MAAAKWALDADACGASGHNGAALATATPACRRRGRLCLRADGASVIRSGFILADCEMGLKDCMLPDLWVK